MADQTAGVGEALELDAARIATFIGTRVLVHVFSISGLSV